MNIIRIPVGVYQANCYLVIQEGKALLIDPGKNVEKIFHHLPENTQVEAIVLTHGHFDHIGAVDNCVAALGCPVYMNPLDEPLVRSKELNSLDGHHAHFKSPIVPLVEGTQKIGSFTCINTFMPGHTPGCTVIQIGEALFTGDVLFKGSVGRTDLPLGDPSQMAHSLQKFKDMDPSLVVYPGHDEPTDLETELKTNYYL